MIVIGTPRHSGFEAWHLLRTAALVTRPQQRADK